MAGDRVGTGKYNPEATACLWASVTKQDQVEDHGVRYMSEFIAHG